MKYNDDTIRAGVYHHLYCSMCDMHSTIESKVGRHEMHVNEHYCMDRMIDQCDVRLKVQ